MALQAHNTCQCPFSFPLKKCFAVSLVIDKQTLSMSTRKMMGEIPIDLDKIRRNTGD